MDNFLKCYFKWVTVAFHRNHQMRTLLSQLSVDYIIYMPLTEAHMQRAFPLVFTCEKGAFTEHKLAVTLL